MRSHRRDLPPRVLALLTTLLIATSATPAAAASFDARGKATLDAAYTLDFEEDEDLSNYVAYLVGHSLSLGSRVQNVEGLEGDWALAFGGAERQAVLPLNPEDLSGRRVELTLWYQPRGTDLSVSLRWMVGDLSNYLQSGDRQSALNLATVVLTPTGRATSDGWLELTTGPIDWALGGEIEPSWLVLTNPQHTASYLYRSFVHDPTAVARVDALEIHDLGPAAVPDTTCTVVDEAETCGDEGVCFLGRCADAAVVLGAPPSGEVRQQYLERRAAEMSLFTAVRQGQARMDEVQAELAALDDVGAREFWTRFGAAHELLVDGHGSPPRTGAFDVYNTHDTCLGPGRADLLPGASDEVVPMVFDSGDPQLQPGDVLTRIDGVDVDAWVASAPRYFYYNGDADGRKALRTANLLGAAMATGATVEFDRCPRTLEQADQPCAPGEVQTITIDFAETFGQRLWLNQVPANFYDYEICDLRFSPRLNPPRNDTNSFYNFADWSDVEGVRHIVFNGFPGTYYGQGQQWKQTLDNALSAAPPMLAIDQRTGYGGQIDGVEFFAGQLLDPANTVVALLYPWLGEAIGTELELAFAECLSEVHSGLWSCGDHYNIAPSGLGEAREGRVALINGFDVSGNDYFARFVAERSAETRIFGYAPTIGAYGVSCQFAPLVWELQPMAYQCHDTRFVDADGVDQGFESGYGVEADEYVYQTMSDALRGEDTILKAAEAWLRQGGAQ